MRLSLVVASIVLVGRPDSAAAACPGGCEVDDFLARASSLSVEKRVREAKALFGKLARPERACPDRPQRDDLWDIWLWEYALLRWADLFNQHGQVDVLAVVDETEVDGGAGAAKCSHFYRRVRGAKGFAAHYGTPAQRRHLGVCGTESAISRLFTTPAPAAAAAPPQKAVVTACQVDRFVDGLGRIEKRARPGVVREIVQRSASAEAADLAGTTYFYTRLAFRYRFVPDPAILEGVDAVAVQELTPGICRFFMNAVGHGGFGRHYRRPQKRALVLRCAGDAESRERLEARLRR